MAEGEINKDQASLVACFDKLSLGEVLALPLSVLTPTQPPDEHIARGDGPIEAFTDRGRILIQNGNHRYYEARSRQVESFQPVSLLTRRVSNPYIDY